jgi:hypothetical protein
MGEFDGNSIRTPATVISIMRPVRPYTGLPGAAT